MDKTDIFFLGFFVGMIAATIIGFKASGDLRAEIKAPKEKPIVHTTAAV